MAICKGTAMVCGLRVSRLSSTCGCISGPNNAVSTSALIRIDSTPEYKIGGEFTLNSGCGEVCLHLKACDQLKRMNLELELCVRDMELLELLTGAHLYSQTFGSAAAQVAGYSRRGVGQSCPDPVSVEIWSKVTSSAGSCSAADDDTPRSHSGTFHSPTRSQRSSYLDLLSLIRSSLTDVSTMSRPRSHWSLRHRSTTSLTPLAPQHWLADTSKSQSSNPNWCRPHCELCSKMVTQ
jgi:hypothetical protein